MDEATTRAPQWGIAPYFLVDDVVMTSEFYRDQLGFRFDRLWGEPPCFCMASRGGITIMLSQIEGGGPMRPNRMADPENSAWDAYLWVDDANALHEELARKGVRIVRPLCDQPYGNRDFEIEDCNGYRLCFGHSVKS